jgi:hypothetical protein
MINEGRGSFKEVRDRKLPTKIDAECLRSQEQGRHGKGMNEQTMNESLADLNQAPQITEE